MGRSPIKKHHVRPSLPVDERGTIFRQSGSLVALGYPAPYRVGASSLGVQTVYRELNGIPGLACERFFLNTATAAPRPLVTLETAHPISRCSAIAFSAACETDLGGIIELLDAAGLAALRDDRAGGTPPVIIGGPLTYVDPRLVAPLADVVVVGEAEPVLARLGRAIAGTRDKAELLEALAGDTAGIWLPGEYPSPPRATHASVEQLPAIAATWSSEAELKNLFLIEATRGCKRGCAFCVMSARAHGAGCFRAIDADRILSAIPADAPGVGLVGAAVTDHPQIEALVEAIVDTGRRVSLSSIRADRLTEQLTRTLKRGGLRTLTLAADGTSDHLRRQIHKGIDGTNLIEAAHLAAKVGLKRLKLYAMVGLPSETDEDINEFATLLRELCQTITISVAVQALVPKPGTPLADQEMAPLRTIKQRLELLKKLIAGRARLTPTSPRWSWVDWKLAHGGERAALAAIQAHRQGGTFSAWRKAIEAFEL